MAFRPCQKIIKQFSQFSNKLGKYLAESPFAKFKMLAV